MNPYQEDPNELTESQLERLREIHRRRKAAGLTGLGLEVASIISLFEESVMSTPQPQPAHVIDCDAPSFIPSGDWKIAGPEHQLPGSVPGQLVWDPAKIEFAFSLNQRTGMVLGTELARYLAWKELLRANVLDYLLAHPEIIPNSWKEYRPPKCRLVGCYIYFWGTIYQDKDGDLFVRCLHYDGHDCMGSCRWLGREFGNRSPAAVLVT